ncbi:WD repeat-containing protein 1-B [Exaiptasia diaphana]|uniref:Actin-interacting protein 1 n=1 Tax=Exaiptasia diaphana TaxID=2652724 RepID=A0A913X0L7_EXADI|nr:WD repeat-containing protein 1-B [Exaiptasia diaphana]KXJ27431.1 WD repeat-containing protein 1-B [Exaiptasia diaphana]
MSLELKTVYPSLPRVKRGAVTVLKADPKGKNFLYANNKSVFIRNVEDPTDCDVYSQHAKDVHVAAYSPSGFYIASGDASGKLRIWDTTNKEHILKYEYQPLSALIKDIVWSPDSKRMVVVGEGREKFGNAFLWDSGSTVGKIDNHAKAINAVDYKTTRPFRVCTGSEDMTCNFYEGPPFKYKKAERDHSNFVNCVKYSPNGEVFITGGADGKLFLYDGKDGELQDEVGKTCEGGKAHKAGIYAISWCQDSKSFLTASADKTCKIWNVDDKTVTTTFTFGSELEDMQLGCLWMGEYLLSLSLSGAINYLDKENPSTPSRVLMGHYKNITAIAYSSQNNKLYSADFEGRIVAWNVSNGSSQRLKGKGHTTDIRYLAVSDDMLVSCAIDDTVRFTNLDTEEYGSDVVALGGQVKGFSCGKDGLVVVSLEREVLVIRDKKVVSRLKVSYETSSVSVHPGQSEVAIGSATEDRVYLYDLSNDTLEEKEQVDVANGHVLHVCYSPDGAYLGVSSDKNRSYAFSTSNYKDKVVEWYGHNGKIRQLKWSPDSRHMATCGLDTKVIVYKAADPGKQAIASIRGAHNASALNALEWTDNNTLVTGAEDCCLRLWTLKE